MHCGWNFYSFSNHFYSLPLIYILYYFTEQFLVLNAGIFIQLIQNFKKYFHTWVTTWLTVQKFIVLLFLSYHVNKWAINCDVTYIRDKVFNGICWNKSLYFNVQPQVLQWTVCSFYFSPFLTHHLKLNL